MCSSLFFILPLLFCRHPIHLNSDLTDNLVASQSGVGTSTFTLDMSTHKKILCVAKSGTTIANVKEIPTSILNANDVIPLGVNLPLVGTNNIASAETIDSNLVGKEVFYKQAGGGYNSAVKTVDSNTSIIDGRSIGLSTDLSSADDVKVTYNGANSFTITSVSGVNVYVYA